MTPSSRDRISVDLQGFKAPLFERALARGVSLSGLVRDALIDALGQTEPSNLDHVAVGASLSMEDRVRLSLRMSREEASLRSQRANSETVNFRWKKGVNFGWKST